MPLPRGFIQTVFASDDAYPAGPDPWALAPIKLPLTGYSLGFVPGETVPADSLNFELSLASKLRYLNEIEALNWTDGTEPLRAGLNDIGLLSVVWIASERIWLGVSLGSGATKALVVSSNGRHWDDATPGSWPLALIHNIAAGETACFIFVAGGDLYLRTPDGSYGGDMSSIIAGPAAVAGWAQASTFGADNWQSAIRDPAEENRIWIAFRTSADIPSIARVQVGSVATVPNSETAGLAAFTWDADEYVSFFAHGDRRIVCFVATNTFAQQVNVIRWSDAAPDYLTAWGGGSNNIGVVSAVGKIVGLGASDDEDNVIALMSSGLCYRSSDLQTWIRVDVEEDDVEREFFCCVQVGAITYARGIWTRTSTESSVEGIFFSLDYGQNWKFTPGPLNVFGLPVTRRLRGFGDRLCYHAQDGGGSDALSEIAHALLTGAV